MKSTDLKKILMIVPYANIYPPINGGMQRCFHIINQLAKYFELTLIIHQNKDTFFLAAQKFPAITSVKVYSTFEAQPAKDIFSFLPSKLEKALRYRWLKKSIKGPADDNFLAYHAILTKLLHRENFDIAILENIATLNVVGVIRSINSKIHIIYDAHNVDTHLAIIEHENKLLSEKALKSIKKSEANLHRLVDSVIVCSGNDQKAFKNLNAGKLSPFVIPNGVFLEPFNADEILKKEPNFLLFCGSLGYGPNVDAVLWFYNEVWHKVRNKYPRLKFIILGSGAVPKQLNKSLTDNSIIFTGTVDAVKPYYDKAILSVVPIHTGSGTRLKILEGMGYGVPIISTSKGAEGISYINGDTIIIADTAQKFTEAISMLIDDADKRNELLLCARSSVEKTYDWDIIGLGLRKFIEDQIKSF